MSTARRWSALFDASVVSSAIVCLYGRRGNSSIIRAELSGIHKQRRPGSSPGLPIEDAALDPASNRPLEDARGRGRLRVHESDAEGLSSVTEALRCQREVLRFVAL